MTYIGPVDMQQIQRRKHRIEEQEEVGFPIQVREIHAPSRAIDYFGWEQVDSQVEPCVHQNITKIINYNTQINVHLTHITPFLSCLLIRSSQCNAVIRDIFRFNHSQ